MLLCMTPAWAMSQDTLALSKDRHQHYSLNPMKATMYAAALPGLGQIYNRKYWKVPIVYAGFGALGYAASYNSKNYNTFLNAYQDFTDIIPETDSYLDLLTSLDPSMYDPVLYPESYEPTYESWVKTQLMNGVEYYRRYRDLSYIGIVAWYLVTVIDAHVDASLFDYDISDDLKASVGPVFTHSQGMMPGVALTLVKNF